MRRMICSFLFLFWGVPLYGQTVPSLTTPTAAQVLTQTNVTFTWPKAAGTFVGYEVYVASTTANPNVASVPASLAAFAAASTTEIGWYLMAGNSTAPASPSLTTTLHLVSGKTYNAKVRVRLTTGSPNTYSAWSAVRTFTISTPKTAITLLNHVTLALDHTFGKITGLTYKDGSNSQLLAATGDGIGGTGATADSLESWSDDASPCMYTYSNYAKYGTAGSKVLTVTYDANGVEVAAVVTLAATKTTTMTTSWTPGGTTVNGKDVAIFDDGTIYTRIPVDYATHASIGATSVKHVAFFDTDADEYAGFKTASALSVTTSTDVNVVQTVISLPTTSTVTFAVHKKAKYFDTWGGAKNTYAFLITKPTSPTVPGWNDVTWGAYGATPDAIKLYNGTSWTVLKTLTVDEQTASTANVLYPLGNARTGYKIGLYASATELDESGLFSLSKRNITITTPAQGATIARYTSSVVWNNDDTTVFAAGSKIKLSLDGTNWADAEETAISTPNLTGVTTVTQNYAFKGREATGAVIGLFENGATKPIAQSGTCAITKAAVIVADPSGPITPGFHDVTWTNTGTKVTLIKFKTSTNGTVWGSAWGNQLSITEGQTELANGTMSFEFKGATASQAHCKIAVFDAAGAVDSSAEFTISAAGAEVSIVHQYSDPGSDIVVPVVIKNAVTAGSSTTIRAFSLKLKYNSHFVVLTSGGAPKLYAANGTDELKTDAADPLKWTISYSNSVGSGSAEDNSSFTISAYQLKTTGDPQTEVILKVPLTVVNDATHAGGSTGLNIDQTAVIADGNAKQLDVTSYGSGVLDILTSVAGTVKYFYEVGTPTPFTIQSAGLIKYADAHDLSVPGARLNATTGDVAANGTYFIGSRGGGTDGPNSHDVTYGPSYNTVPVPVTNKIGVGVDAIDAGMAFTEGFSPVLSNRGKIAADIDENGVINILDAIGILDIATDSWYAVNPTIKRWVFAEVASLQPKVTGTATATGKAVTGIGSVFDNAAGHGLATGNVITIAGQTRTVDVVTNSTALTVTADFTPDVAIASEIFRPFPTGTISTSNSTTVTGVGTNFVELLNPGMTITAAGQTRTIATVAAATSLTVTSKFSPDVSGAKFEVLAFNSTFRSSTMKSQIVQSPLPVGQIQTGKDFIGVLRGDIDFSLFQADALLLKSNASMMNAVYCSLPNNIQTVPGDVVTIPVNVELKGHTIGAYTAYIQLDKNMFSSFVGCTEGAAFPSGKGWVVSTKYNAETGRLIIATTDFAYPMVPITNDGTIFNLHFTVTSSAKRGDIQPITISALSVADEKLNKLSAIKSDGVVEITRLGSTVVAEYQLSENYPNPFNPSTVIEFALPKDSNVDIRIYNIIGQEVATLFNGIATVGYHQVEFNASNMSSGIYFYTIKASSLAGDQSFSSVKRMMLMK